jgi:hypothetical protein
MVGIEGGSFELVFALFNAQAAIFATDDIQLADHVVVVCQMFGVYV